MKLRLPAELRDRVAEEAKANGRSMNAEIVLRLERSLDRTSAAQDAYRQKAEKLDAVEQSARAGLDDELGAIIDRLEDLKVSYREHADHLAKRERGPKGGENPSRAGATD